MRCESIQQRLSTWANESHSVREARNIERHLATCQRCRAYRDRVATMDRIMAGVAPEALTRDLRPKLTRAAPRRQFTARQWAPAAGIATMFLGALLASRHGHGYAASASEAVRRMAQIMTNSPAFHQCTWLAEGEHQEGQLKLLDEIWFDNGQWRKTSAPDRGGDRIVKTENGQWAYYARWQDGQVHRELETSPQPVEPRLSTYLGNIGLAGSEAAATDLGITQLDGRSADEISVPSYKSQRTLIWLVPGSDLPLRIERQNLQDQEWHTSWVDTFDLAEHWPATRFNVSTLGGGGQVSALDTPAVSTTNAILAPAQPTWKSGNVLFAGLIAGDHQKAASACFDEESAKAVQLAFTGLMSQYGSLTRYGSFGPGEDIDSRVRTTTQVFDLTFGKQKLTAVLSFRRDDNLVWKATSLTVKQPNQP